MTIARQDLASAARLFHALSDDTRLAVVRRLRDGEHCVCDLMDQVDAAQSRLSFHLRVLREAGIVGCRREGRWAYYWLKPDTFEAAVEAIKGLSPSRAGRQAAARCCD
ncbi:MAG TPA: metalloregulator ArsR/SmtB family transcription factor [Gemmatimonadales bacterium]|nr:metalloregulator ArsR/SmtB family transcription factor [Gemmatimonadales bacterium]